MTDRKDAEKLDEVVEYLNNQGLPDLAAAVARAVGRERERERGKSRQWAADQARQLNAECEADIEKLHGRSR